MFDISPALIITLLVVGLVLFLIQPLILKGACGLCGEKSPGYGMGFLAILMSAIAGSIAGTVYGLTLGAVIGAFSGALAGIGGVLLSFFVTAVVYSAFLRVSVMRGAGVAIVHHLLSFGVFALTGLAIRTLLAMGIL